MAILKIFNIFTSSNSTKFLILILVISAFFRFYNLQNFQYWTTDEEIAATIVHKMIVEKKPALIIPNSTIGSSLGPFFHYLSVPLFLVSGSNPEIVLALMGFVGIFTTYLIFAVGKAFKDTPLGLVAAFLYASSFVSGLYDRRWWPLSLNPLLAIIAIFSLIQIKNNKKYIYSVPLATTVGFAFHADPSIAIIAFSTIIIYLLLKISFFKKEYLLGALTLFIFIAPLFIFELRHPGMITKPLLHSLGQSNSTQASTFLINSQILMNKATIVFSNLTFPLASDFADRYIASGFTNISALFGYSIVPLLLVVAICLPVAKFFRKKTNQNDKDFLIILYSFIFTFSLATFLFAVFYQKPVHQHYFTIIFPVFFLLLAYTLTNIIKNKKIIAFILLTYFLVNANTLLNSQFKYPLHDKRLLISNLDEKIGQSDFSLYAPGNEYFIGGGFTTLFILDGKNPKRSYAYDYYDWMYRAYSLYTIAPQDTDLAKIAIISQNPQNFPPDKVVFRKKVGNLEGIILDNQDNWFKQDMLN